MFGLNDNQQSANNSGSEDGPPAIPANPFGDTGPSPVTSPPPEPQTINPSPSAPAISTPSGTNPPASSNSDDSLIDLKQQALQNLQPLVSHLDQSPEEKFKTTMMLIQATDNSALVKQAYEAANQITDEKARAQALLDVVNEINYFTHHQNGEAETKTN